MLLTKTYGFQPSSTNVDRASALIHGPTELRKNIETFKQPSNAHRGIAPHVCFLPRLNNTG